MQRDLWSGSLRKRLNAARQIEPSELSKIHKSLGRSCPIDPWPYGNATVINPFLVTLGVSPGDSPAAGDIEVVPGGHEYPTAGSPHPGTSYNDTKGYWNKLRLLARLTLTPSGGDEKDALALFGNLNLDTGRSGEAKNVIMSLEFSNWILHTICHGLKPRFLVMLGLSTYLHNNSDIANLFEKTFKGFDLKKPHRKIRFSAYSKKNHIFREWDVLSGETEMTIVMWPQHPSRAPFSNIGLWKDSCQEFAERYQQHFQ